MGKILILPIEIIDKYNSGKNLTELSNEYFCSREAIGRFLTRNGVKKIIHKTGPPKGIIYKKNIIESESFIGKKINFLTILEVLKERKNSNIVFRCLCDCGNKIDVIKTYILFEQELSGGMKNG